MKDLPKLKLAQEWFDKAQNDLTSAQILFSENGPCDTICFLCQQAAEKYLKGYLIFNGEELKKIHDLLILINQIAKLDKDFTRLLSEGELLNPYYIETRYPPHPLPVSKKQAKEALRAAQEIVELVQNKVLKFKQ